MFSIGNMHWMTGGIMMASAALLSSQLLHNDPAALNTEQMLDVSVSIKSISPVSIDGMGDSVWNSQIGSGFLVSKEQCEIWTNHHVIKEAAVIEVFPRNWTGSHGIPAQLINGSEHSDIAILKMTRCDPVSQAQLGDTDSLSQGDEVYAVGNPLGKNPDSISRGIISHTERYLKDGIPYLQTDAIIGPGSSGGGLFNRRGQVIGINTGIASSGSMPYAGIGYAIPINLARKAVSRLRAGTPRWGSAGIEQLLTGLHRDEARLLGVPGNFNAVSLTHSPVSGSSHGLLLARDVIFGVNHRPIKGLGHAKHLIRSLSPGEVVSFSIVRDNQIQTVDIRLENGWKPEPMPEPEYYSGHLGMQLEMWNNHEGEAGQFQTPVITQVQSMGPAHLSRIASSQHDMIFFDGYAIRRILDVKTITGVVLAGHYHRVSSVELVDDLASAAFTRGEPMLLEIEVWRRSEPQLYSSPLQRFNTVFHRLDPAPTSAMLPPDEVGKVNEEPIINTELNRFTAIDTGLFRLP